MTTTAGHSFYIGPIGSFYNQVNDAGSWEPLVFFTVTGTVCSNISEFQSQMQVCNVHVH
jgi:hypothetical protein